MSEAFNHLSAAERTELGRVRENNEDALLCLPRLGLFAVADGMGGAREGEVAAQAVVDHLRDACGNPELPLLIRTRRCREALDDASVWIRQYAAKQGNPGMGTTVAALLFDPDDSARATAIHAGDSRLYRLRGGALEQLTRDHSVAAMVGADGQGQVPAIFRSVLTRAVGVRRNVEAEATTLEVRRGDLFLLCTDGLYGLVPLEAMTRIMASGRDLESMAVELVESALAKGGDDNVTAVLVRVGPDLPAAAGAAAGAAGVPEPASSIPRPARDAARHPGSLAPLVSLLIIALLGVAGVWFAFVPLHRGTASRSERVTVPPPPPAPLPEKPDPAPPPETVAAPLPPSAPAEDTWAREREEVAAVPERVKARHADVIAAFTRLSEWAGKPLEAPSLMILGRPEDKPDAWCRYLGQAQQQWRTFCAVECARLEQESACLAPERLAALWNWTALARGETNDAPFRAAQAACRDWREELERMDRFLREEPGTGPFLYALRADLFTPGRNAAALGDRAWTACLPWVDEVWKTHDYWTARKNGDAEGRVDHVLKLANAVWAGYAALDYAIRPWRQTLKPEALNALLDLMIQETR